VELSTLVLPGEAEKLSDDGLNIVSSLIDNTCEKMTCELLASEVGTF